MPSKFLNWSDVLQANQGSGQAMANQLNQSAPNSAYEDAMRKYKQDYSRAMDLKTNSAREGYVGPEAGRAQWESDRQKEYNDAMQAASASYGDAYKAMQAASQSNAGLDTLEGRQVALSKNGQRANWLDSALAGSYMPGAGAQYDSRNAQIAKDANDFVSGTNARSDWQIGRAKGLQDFNRGEAARIDAEKDAAKDAYDKAVKGYEFYKGDKSVKDRAGNKYQLEGYWGMQDPTSGLEYGSDAWKHAYDLALRRSARGDQAYVRQEGDPSGRLDLTAFGTYAPGMFDVGGSPERLKMFMDENLTKSKNAAAQYKKALEEYDRANSQKSRDYKASGGYYGGGY